MYYQKVKIVELCFAQRSHCPGPAVPGRHPHEGRTTEENLFRHHAARCHEQHATGMRSVCTDPNNRILTPPILNMPAHAHFAETVVAECVAVAAARNQIRHQRSGGRPAAGHSAGARRHVRRVREHHSADVPVRVCAVHNSHTYYIYVIILCTIAIASMIINLALISRSFRRHCAMRSGLIVSPKSVQAHVTLLENLHIILEKTKREELRNEIMPLLYLAFDSNQIQMHVSNRSNFTPDNNYSGFRLLSISLWSIL